MDKNFIKIKNGENIKLDQIPYMEFDLFYENCITTSIKWIQHHSLFCLQ